MKNNSSEFDLVENYFPTIYLTIIALIQGIALSTLAGNFIEEIRAGFPVSGYIYYIKYILVISIIFLTWHHYMYGIIYLRWFPGILDTLIPLSLGAAQFIIAGIIREPSQSGWYYSLCLFFTVAGFAYLNAAIKTTPLLFSECFGRDLSEKYNTYITTCNVLAGMSCFVHSAFTVLIASKILPYGMISIIELLLIFHIIAYEIFYRNKIKPHYLLMLRGRKNISTKDRRS